MLGPAHGSIGYMVLACRQATAGLQAVHVNNKVTRMIYKGDKKAPLTECRWVRMAGGIHCTCADGGDGGAAGRGPRGGEGGAGSWACGAASHARARAACVHCPRPLAGCLQGGKACLVSRARDSLLLVYGL
jgi:hypothetical protein